MASPSSQLIFSKGVLDQWITCSDLRTGGLVRQYSIGNQSSSFKSSPIDPLSVAPILVQPVTGDYLYFCSPTKSLIYIFDLRHQKVVHYCSVPEQITCIDISSDEAFLCAGSRSGKLYFWHAPSGSLIKQVSAHFNHVTNVRFSKDGQSIFSSGMGGSIVHYHLSSILNPSNKNTVIEPFGRYINHKMAITSLETSNYSYLNSRALYSTSRDGSFSVLSYTGQKLGVSSSYDFKTSVESVCFFDHERFPAFGLGNGSLYLYNLAVDSSSTIQPIQLTPNLFTSNQNKNLPISFLSTVYGSSLCLAASYKSNQIFSYDVESNVVVTKLNIHRSPIQSMTVQKLFPHMEPRYTTKASQSKMSEMMRNEDFSNGSSKADSGILNNSKSLGFSSIPPPPQKPITQLSKYPTEKDITQYPAVASILGSHGKSSLESTFTDAVKSCFAESIDPSLKNGQGKSFLSHLSTLQSQFSNLDISSDSSSSQSTHKANLKAQMKLSLISTLLPHIDSFCDQLLSTESNPPPLSPVPLIIGKPEAEFFTGGKKSYLSIDYFDELFSTLASVTGVKDIKKQTLKYLTLSFNESIPPS